MRKVVLAAPLNIFGMFSAIFGRFKFRQFGYVAITFLGLFFQLFHFIAQTFCLILLVVALVIGDKIFGLISVFFRVLPKEIFVYGQCAQLILDGFGLLACVERVLGSMNKYHGHVSVVGVK